MLSQIPPLLLLLASLVWAGFTYMKQSQVGAETAKLQAIAVDLPKLRARNADLREMETLPQEIARLKRENADLPSAREEVQRLAKEKAELEKRLTERKDSLQQEHLSRLLDQGRQELEHLEAPLEPAAPIAPPAFPALPPRGL